jgi:Cytochrome c554 and c-prime/NapC/NirT cytochrome c family, N-terminal region
VSAARAVAGLVVLGAAGWALVAVFRPRAPELPSRTFTSSAQCAECHRAQYDEWHASQHAKAWTNPEVRALSNDFANTDCIDCHAPRAVFLTGIGNRVLPRSDRRGEGVDCIACHMLPDGRVAGTIDDPNAACRPVSTVDLARPVFCAGCHDQHQTVQQWRDSRFAAEGVDCSDCHLPERDRGNGRMGRDHGMWGGHDIDLVKSAVTLRGEREDGRWVAVVENVHAGHSFPTDDRSRAADVFWRPRGETTWRHLYRFRSPYRHEVDLPDTLLKVHATQRIPLPEDAPGAVEVALFFKRKPYWEDPDHPDPDREAFLLYEIELAP